MKQRRRAGETLGPSSAAEEESNAVRCRPLGDLHPTSVTTRTWARREPLCAYSSEPPSVTSQSQAFQKIVGARIDASMLVTRSLKAVTSGNWKIVTP